MSALRSLRTSAAAAIIVAIICGGARTADAVTTTLVQPSLTGAGINTETNTDRYHRVVLPDDAYGAGVPGAEQSTGSGLQLRCEPGQRAVIRNVGAATVAECVDGTMAGSGYTTTRAALTYPVSEVREYRPVVRTSPVAAQRPVRTVSVDRRPGRDWKKTAMVIGGSSAAGAGVGAIPGDFNDPGQWAFFEAGDPHAFLHAGDAGLELIEVEIRQP